MASLVLGTVGAVIGGIYGGPAGASAGWTLGSTIGSIIDPPKGPTVEGPRLSDLKSQVSDFGTVIPVLYGADRITGNVIWATSIKETKHKKKSQAGKGGPVTTTISYTYSQSFAVGLCEGVITGIRRIWANGELIYTASATATAGSISDSKKNLGNWRVYTGTEDQLVDPTIESFDGQYAVPFRGTAYVVFEDLQLEKFGNRTPQLEFEVVKDGTIIGFRRLGTTSTFGQTDLPVTADNCFYRYGFPTQMDIVGPRLTSYNNGYARFTNPIIQAVPDDTIIFDPALAFDYTTNFDDTPSNFPPLIQTVRKEDNKMSPYKMGYQIVGGVSYSRVPIGFLGDSYVDLVIPTLKTTAWTHQFSERGKMLWGGYYYFQAFTPDLDRYGDGSFDLFALIPDQDKYFYGCTPTPDGSALYIYGGDTPLNFDNNLGPVSNIASAWYKIEMGTYEPRVTGSGVFAGAYDAFLDLGFIGFSIDMNPSDSFPALNPSSYASCAEPSGTIWTFADNPNKISTFEIESGIFTRTHSLSPITSTGYNATMIAIDGVCTVIAFGITKQTPGFLMQYITSGVATRNEIIETSSLPLSAVVLDQCQRVGYDPSEVDVSGLSDLVYGYVLANLPSARGGIQTLQNAFFFDPAEIDGILRFIKRGNTPIDIIDASSMGAFDGQGNEPQEALEITRNQELALPRQVSITYSDKDADYRAGLQYTSRQTTDSVITSTIEYPGAISGDKAKQMSEVVLYSSWLERESFDFKTSLYYFYLSAADVVTVRSNAGNVWTVRITKIQRGANNILEFTAVKEQPSLYSTDTKGIYVPPSGPQQINGTVPTFDLIYNGPSLNPSIDVPGYYFSSTGYTDGWAGALVQNTSDGLNFNNVDDSITVGSENSVMGYAKNVIGNWEGGNAWDTENYLDVSIVGVGELSSTTALNIFNGSNSIYLGGEILQFMNATLIGIGRYRLSNFLRGRRATQRFIGTHQPNEVFALLDENDTKFITDNLANVGVSEKLKVIGLTELSPELEPVQQFEFLGSTIIPNAPVMAKGINQPDGEVLFNWVRCARLNFDWYDRTDVPLDEPYEEYTLEFSATSDFSDIRRTLDLSDVTSYTYSISDRTADFGSVSTPIFVRVFQISSRIGRGYPATFDIIG